MQYPLFLRVTVDGKEGTVSARRGTGEHLVVFADDTSGWYTGKDITIVNRAQYARLMRKEVEEEAMLRPHLEQVYRDYMDAKDMIAQMGDGPIEIIGIAEPEVHDGDSE